MCGSADGRARATNSCRRNTRTTTALVAATRSPDSPVQMLAARPPGAATVDASNTPWMIEFHAACANAAGHKLPVERRAQPKRYAAGTIESMIDPITTNVQLMKDGSLLVSDDWNGAVYRITYGKQKTAAAK